MGSRLVAPRGGAMQISLGSVAQWAAAYADETVTAGPDRRAARGRRGAGGPQGSRERGPRPGGGDDAAMIRAFSFPVSPERGRLRGWLEGSLAGLCELHWLRERQEFRVRQALRLGQPLAAGAGPGGAADDGRDQEDEALGDDDGEEDDDEAAARRAAAALEEQLEALPGLMWELGQHLGELSLDAEGLEEDVGLSSGFYEGPSPTAPDSPPSTFGGDSGFSGSGSYSRLGPSEPRGVFASERPKSLGEAGPSSQETSAGGRAAVPRSFSAPYPTAPQEAGPGGASSFLSPSPLHAVALQSPRLRGRLYPDSPLVGPPDGAAPGRHLESYISGLLRRRRRLRGRPGPGQPRTSPGPGPAEPPAALRRQNSARQRSEEQPHPGVGGSPGPGGWPAWDSSPPPAEPAPALSSSPPSPGEGRLVKAQYIPAAHAGVRGPPVARAARRKGPPPPPLTRGRSVELSPPRERPRPGGTRKGRFPDGAVRRGSPRGKKAARSQSENSLLNRPGAGPGEPKYHTVEREEPRPARPRRTPAGAAPASSRRWRSTAEISGEEAEGGRRGKATPRGGGGRAAGGGPGPSPAPPRRLLYGCAGSDSECSAGRGGAVGRRAPPLGAGGSGGGSYGPAYGESESSASDGESLAFSSASSDSEGSGGGLVWPQQLAAASAAAGPGGPGGAQGKVFVKIKASHALKKKILRFRSGSLKVMTTV